jgi:proline dehydrogenase
LSNRHRKIIAIAAPKTPTTTTPKRAFFVYRGHSPIHDAVANSTYSSRPILVASFTTIVQIRVFEDLAELKHIILRQGEFDLSACRTPTQDPIWSLSFAETLAFSKRCYFVAVMHLDRIVGLAPFVQRRQGLEYLEYLGNRYLGEPGELFAENEAALEILIEYLAKEQRRMVYRRTLANCESANSFQRYPDNRLITTASSQGDYPYIDLNQAQTSVDEVLSTRMQSDLRRARRKASSIGELSFDMSSPRSGDEFSEKFKILLEVEAAGWKRKSGTALALDIPKQAFFRTYGQRAAERGMLRVATLLIAQAPAAIQYAVEIANRYYLLKIGFDEKFAACSPGNLLMYEALKYTFEVGNQSFEFLGASDSWTDRWSNSKRNTVRIEVCPTRLAKLGQFVGQVSRCSSQILHAHQDTHVSKTRPLVMKNVVRSGIRKLKQKASRNYISGPNAEDARTTSLFLGNLGYWVSQGYWDGSGDSPSGILGSYLRALHNLSSEPGRNTLSIKIPSLDFDDERFDALCRESVVKAIPIHFDSLGPESASRTFAFIDRRMADHPNLELGCTLPGRWRRSISDAEFVVNNALAARVVKGQWTDPKDPTINAREGFMDVVEALCGRAACVRVATHDVHLATRAVRALRDSDTRCEIELLYGMPIAPIAKLAVEYQVPVRIYVAFGHAYLPYAIRSLRSNPALLARLAKDALRTNYRVSIPRFSLEPTVTLVEGLPEN